MDRALVLRYRGIGFESQLARALKERQCTLKGQARYVNVWGSVHWECAGWGIETWGCKIFFLVFKIDQSETTKSHMFSTSLRLTNHKQLTAKEYLRVNCRRRQNSHCLFIYLFNDIYKISHCIKGLVAILHYIAK